MTPSWLEILRLLAMLGCGLMAGIFFAFSNFVMRAFARICPSQGIAAMQAVNITVLNPLFMLAFMGTAALCIADIALALVFGSGNTVYLIAGGALYLLGNIGVTAVFNVPMNDALAAVDAGQPDTVHIGKHYLDKWTFWNHVRTITALAAAAAFTLALVGSPAASS
ncbi:MAG: anthrone oxygenase family protein [Gallionella sp.]